MVQRPVEMVRAGHDYRLVEQSGSCGGLQQGIGFPAPAGLPENGHIVRVPAEGVDVPLNPFQGLHKVCDASVDRVIVPFAVGGEVQIPQNIQPVVQCDHHDIPIAAQGVSFIGCLLKGGAV